MHINAPKFTDLVTKSKYNFRKKKKKLQEDVLYMTPYLEISTYTHFGSGVPQSAQTILPDSEIKAASFCCGPNH